jgi:hypothetical protein
VTKIVSIGNRINDAGAYEGLLEIDPLKLVRNRCLVTANSGGGKSYVLRKLMEVTHGHFPHHVLDPEGEFHTLRERFDYVLAGRPGGQAGDCPINPKHAAHLARRMVELGVSVIIDLQELKQPDRELFVKNYITGLIELPRHLWRTLMVLLDEAQKYCPEKGEMPSQSTEAVLDLMTRGRKRGFCGVLATQRISMLHKSAAAECVNRMIGRTGLDVDLDRAGKALGYNAKHRETLKRLEPGTFHVFGPAFGPEVERVHIGKVLTTHPEAGEATPAPAPPRGRIAKVLAELANLPDEADAEIKSAEDMKARIRELEAQVRVAETALAKAAREVPSNRTSMAPGPGAIDKALRDARREAHGIGCVDGHKSATDMAIATLQKMSETMEADRARFERCTSDAIKRAFDVIRKGTPKVTAPPPAKPTNGESVTPRTFFLNERHELPPSPAGDARGPEQKILDALRWFAAVGVADPDITQVAFMAGYSPNTKSFKNARGALRSKGMIEYVGDGRTRLTDAGVEAARLPDVPKTNAAFHQVVLDMLPGPSAKLLKELLPRRAQGLETEILADLTGYSFKNARGHLRSLGFVEYGGDGTTFATELMYPERS